MTPGHDVRPLRLRREGDSLRVEWSDGVTTRVSWRTLRSACPCASCNDERSKPADPFKVLKPSEVAAGPPAPVAVRPVGHYAYQISWNDGHDAGIYPVKTIRELSEVVG
jgi:DUF971 family protein